MAEKQYTSEELARRRRKPKMTVSDFMQKMNEGKPKIPDDAPQKAITPTQGKQTSLGAIGGFSDTPLGRKMEKAFSLIKPYDSSGPYSKKPKKRMKSIK